MRILVDYRAALRARTGVGEYIHELVRAYCGAYGDEMMLFSSSWKDRPDAAVARAMGATLVDRRIPVRALNLLWHRAEWPPAETLAGAVDVTHSAHPLLLPSRAAAQVVMIHDLNFLSHPERTRAEIRRDYPALTRDHAHRADAIIVPPHFTAGEVERKLEVPAGRIGVCSPGAPDWSPRTAVPPNGYVLFVGTLEPRKNVGTLLDAYERLLARRRPPDLVLAGKATDESGAWLERIGRPPLAGHARHIGYVEAADRKALYEGAAVLVQPSYEEGFGIPVLEAMTIGVPVVAANRGALPEVLGDAGLLFEAEDADALESALDRMLTDQSLAAASAAKGAVRSQGFRWDRAAERVIEVYRQAIERRARRR